MDNIDRIEVKRSLKKTKVYLSGTDLRQVQLAQLEILKEFAAVCEQHNLQYFLCFGTLLGAVRHRGFIPWDDDLDVGMPREDYDRFLEIADQALDHKKYYCLSWNTHPDYGMPYAKIKKKGTIYQEERGSKKHNELFIDVFPYDVYPGTVRSFLCQALPLSFLGIIIRLKTGEKPWDGKGIGGRIKYIPFLIASIFSQTGVLKKKYDKLARHYNNKPDQYVHRKVCRENAKPLKWVVHKKMILPTEPILFEDDYFQAPVNADAYLRSSFGDYMTPPPKGQRENRHGIIEWRL